MMSKAKGGDYPSPEHRVSMSGKPTAFQHVEQIGPQFEDAASGKREKRTLRIKAPRVTKAFHKAHEGPREKIAEPKSQMAYRPSGKIVAEVHTKHDNEARRRNRDKDQQMKKWRERRITMSHRFNTKAKAPMHLRAKKTPEVFPNAARKAALKDRLAKKKDQGNDGYSL
jgi:hypothetical protein